MIRGQASLEFVLVLAAFLAALALILPAIFSLADGIQWWNEARNAQQFAQAVQDGAKELELFGEGSQLGVKGNPQSEWTVSVQGNELEVKAECKGSGKSITRTLALEGENFEETFSAPFELLLKKQNNSIVFEAR
ncbi:MAG: hypothetical protein V1847_00065 [Candidatus Diapherotrites archaeon]